MGGGTMASARSTSLNRGMGVEPPEGPGAEPLVPGGGQGANHLPHETESFLSIQNSGQKLRI